MERNLMEPLKYNKANKFFYDVERVLFHISHLFLLMGKHDEAKKYLSEALMIAGNNEYISFLEREYLNDREVFDFAVDNNIGKDLIKRIHSGIADRAAIPWISIQAAERQNKQIDNIWDIEMEAFGILRFKVRGRYITDDKWVRKKSRLLLCWLILNKDKKLNKDILIEMFFGELSAESAENVFHQVVHNIKSVISDALNNNITAGSVKPELVKYEHKNLFLNPDYYYHSDIERFDLIFSQIKECENTDNKAELLKMAKSIYKGDLFYKYNEQWCIEMKNEYAEKLAIL